MEGRHPCEGAVEDPPPGQQDDALRGLVPFAPFHADALTRRVGFCLLAAVSLVDEAEVHGLSRDRLDFGGEGGDWCSVTSVSGGDVHGEQRAERSNGSMARAAFPPFVPVAARPMPARSASRSAGRWR